MKVVVTMLDAEKMQKGLGTREDAGTDWNRRNKKEDVEMTTIASSNSGTE